MRPLPITHFWASVAFVCAVSPSVWAQRAEYVKPEELPGEGLSHLAELGMLGEYSKVDDSVHVGAFALRTRFYLGRVPAYCTGLDGAIGASSSGFVYDATLYPIGLGARFGSASVISLCGGARIDAIGSEVPRAFSFPAELSAAISIGPVRPIVWLRPSWVIEKEARRDGVEPSFIDELEAGLLFRIGRQHRYWSKTSAGGGPTLGVGYRGLMDTYAISVLLGFDFAGER